MVQTPVGARCPDCAQLYKLPTYRVSSIYYVRATVTAAGVGIATGLLWGFITRFVPFGYLFNLLLGGAAGYVCAEVIGLAVNRKRGVGLAVIAGGATLLSYLVAQFVPWGLAGFSIFDLVAVGIGIFVAVNRIR